MYMIFYETNLYSLTQLLFVHHNNIIIQAIFYYHSTFFSCKKTTQLRCVFKGEYEILLILDWSCTIYNRKINALGGGGVEGGVPGSDVRLKKKCGRV